ncbi:MAG TPA: glycosyltransferase [Pyrinomonadaceae bacterium]|nr:glycosyltransferase [Pyrinomonadaceae bacterium]
MARAVVLRETDPPVAPASEHATIAVLIPCYNEEVTIAAVVRQFKEQLPESDIYVFDNNSSDDTVAEAISAGAIVARERRQGKGYVVQSMFQQINADVYVIVDGDGTYPAEEVQRILGPVLADEADMVIGSRLHTKSQSQFRTLNRLGNRLFLTILNWTFKVRITDMLSGYRAFSRRFVKSVPLFGGGFETETELTIKALQRGFRIAEVPINLGIRPKGSFSKIRIAHDGLRIANTLLALFRDYKPLTFFGTVGLVLILIGLIPAFVVVFEFLETGLVSSLPSAVLAVGLVLAGLLALTVGLVLHTIVRRSQEFDHQLRVLTDEMKYQIKRELAQRREGKVD